MLRCTHNTQSKIISYPHRRSVWYWNFVVQTWCAWLWFLWKPSLLACIHCAWFFYWYDNRRQLDMKHDIKIILLLLLLWMMEYIRYTVLCVTLDCERIFVSIHVLLCACTQYAIIYKIYKHNNNQFLVEWLFT